MNRKILFLFLLLASFVSKGEAFYADIQPRIGVFYPGAHKFRDIYSAINPLYQIESSFHFGERWQPIPWKVWVNLSFVSEGGKTLHDRHKTGCKLFPISAGLKYSWVFCEDFSFYLGAGASGTYSWFTEHCHSGTRHIFKRAAGAVAKSGIQYTGCRGYLIDLFCDYSLCYLHIGKTRHCDLKRVLNISALMIGGGIGVPF